jgi:hypothetical protein
MPIRTTITCVTRLSNFRWRITVEFHHEGTSTFDVTLPEEPCAGDVCWLKPPRILNVGAPERGELWSIGEIFATEYTVRAATDDA